MNVGFFTEIYRPVVNGVVASIDALAAGLREAGHEVAVFAPSAPGYEHDEPPVFRIPSLPLPIASPYRLTLPRVPRGARERVLDRLHVVHAHSPFVTGWMAARSARRLRVPLIYTYHTRFEEYSHYVPFEPNMTKRAAETLTRTYANTADAVIVPTAAMHDRLLELGVEVPIEVVASGIDVGFFAAGTRSERVRSELGAGEGERLLLTVSRLAREKNIELLLQALALAENSLRLAIAGDGPYREDLASIATSLGVTDRVRFLGAVSRERLPDFYASCDSFVFASVTETQGLVLPEALAAGAWIIATDTPQIRDVVGTAGVLVPATPEAFARAFNGVPAGAPGSAAAAARAASLRFGHLAQARKVEAVYEHLTRTYVRSTL